MFTPHKKVTLRGAKPLPNLDAGVHTLDYPVYGYKGLTGLRIARVVVPPGNKIVIPDLPRARKFRSSALFIAAIDGRVEPGWPALHGRSPYRDVDRIDYKLYCTYTSNLDEREDRYCSEGLHFCRSKREARGHSSV